MPDGRAIIGKYFACQGGIHMPFSWLTVVRERDESRPVMALMDTGSGYSVLSMEVAVDLLEMSEDKIRGVKPKSAEGFGGKKSELYPWKADLRLRASQAGGDSLLIRNASVYVAEETPELWPAIFGQLTGFQQRWLRHHNHDGHRFWQLSGER